MTEENTMTLEEFSKRFTDIISNRFLKTPDKATYDEINSAIGSIVLDCFAKNRLNSQIPQAGKKRAYYLSAEFLMGRAVINNLISLGLFDTASKMLSDDGTNISKLKNVEDAGLGNGGLGRLAACFMDSAATLSLPVMGYGILYKYGIFKQRIEDGGQVEYPDAWLENGDPWIIAREDESIKIDFDDITVTAVPHDMPVFGYKNNYAVTVRFWEARPIEPFDFKLFNDQDYDAALKKKNEAENISRVLYPADDTDEGKKLRLRQQYFFSCASVRDVIRCYKKIHGTDFSHFAEENIFQLNDTHPTVAIPTLIQILTEEEELPFEEAFNIARLCFAYTNHTIMSEALEKWDVELFKAILSKIYFYITKIDDMLATELSKTDLTEAQLESMKIISSDRISMANLAMFISQNVNGVAKLHTDILKTELFTTWNSVYPSKILNITNGITQRRWLKVANPELAGFVTKLLGNSDWEYDLTKLSGIKKHISDSSVVDEFNNIKAYRRRLLSDYMFQKEGIDIDTEAVLDIQIKRMHEYKRQLMNALSALQMYFDIKDGIIKDPIPTVILIGGKAAPGYVRAKNVIKLICELESLIENDTKVSKYLKLHFIEGYNVSYAEMLVGAADISEQISTAGTEASGTGNMKMMLNGALTLGTLDGANIEIVKEAGRENNYIFGATVTEINDIAQSYDPLQIYEKSDRIKRLLDFIKTELECTEAAEDIYDSLLNGETPDKYYVLYDFDSYYKTKLRAINDFKTRSRTGAKGLENIAGAGVFSSDRAIKNYADKIWQIKPDKLG